MAWYRAGLVTVTNGSPNITGAGTDFVSNTQIGEGFLGPDGRVYEVAQVISATQITLVGNYQGGTAGAQSYALLPTSSFARDLALGAAELLNTFAAVRDGVGAGMFADGTSGVPSVRFSGDQDTGIFRKGANALGFAAGGALKAYVDGQGLGAVAMLLDGNATNMLRINRPYLNPGYDLARISMGVGDANHGMIECGAAVSNNSPGFMAFSTRDPDGLTRERVRFDAFGNFLVGATSGTQHMIQRDVGVSSSILGIGTPAITSIYFQAVDQSAWNPAASAMYAGRNGGSGRSINAGGTVNASGADYAEYMTKADGCGTIAAGDVCGVDADGKLTRTWSVARSFVVKSTDPAYVGGDTWASHMGPRPEAEPDEGDAFAVRLAAWEAELEIARQSVDRIAFCGQVPVNVTGEFDVGDYLVAAANGSGIKAIAIADADITFDQYRRRIGKVWAVRDGRAWVDVQHS